VNPKERRDIARQGANELHAQGGPRTKFNAISARQAVNLRWGRWKQEQDGPKDLETTQAAGRIPPDPD
jgi:hypothetical protein